MIKAPTARKGITIGLALVLILGIAPQISSQETSQNPIREAAEIAFAGGTPVVTADVLYENLNDGDTDNEPTIISLRSAEDYAKGHLPGAVHMDIKTLFTSEGLATIPPDRTVVFVCYTGQSAGYATSALNMLGYDAFALKFGMSAWTGDPEVFVKRFDPDAHTFDYTVDLEAHQPGGPYLAPDPLATTVAGAAEAAFEDGARFITADVLYENLNDGDADNDPTIISLRSADDYAKGHLPGAVLMDVKTLFTADGLATIPPDRSVVFVCYTGQSASQATSALNMLGYDALALKFGMSAWTSDPEVYVKRFNPDVHTFDYTVDLEAHQPGGPYQMPEPLVDAVQAAPQPIPEPTAPPVAEAPATAVASNCVSCHTDQETLETLAVDKELTSEQSSGEG